MHTSCFRCFSSHGASSPGKHADDIAELHELVYMTVQAATQQWEALSRLCTEFEAVKPATDALEQRVFELRSEVWGTCSLGFGCLFLDGGLV